MLGTRIAALRVGAGMNQWELAEKMEVSPSTIGMYEQGRREPSGRRLVLLGRLFGVSTDYLLTGRPVCPQDRAALDRLARSCAEAAGRRRGGAFTAREAEVLMSALVEDACVENR